MPIKQSRAISFLILLIWCIPAGFAIDQTLTVNAADVLIPDSTIGVQVVPGFWNQPALALADREYSLSADTELLFSFNDSPGMELLQQQAPYSISSSTVHIQEEQQYRGNASALILAGGGIELMAGTSSMFAPGSVWNDFSMEFWIYPAAVKNGEQLFSWEGTAWIEDEPVLQEISVHVDQGRLNWLFSDVFIRLEQSEGSNLVLQTSEQRLRSSASIVPRTWTHHLVRYDSQRGVLEYLINGRSEDVLIVSDNRRQNGEPLLPFIGRESENVIHIAPDFHGFLDDFRILRSWLEEPELAIAQNEAGMALIGPIDLGDDNSRLSSFDASYRTPGNTDLRFSIIQRDSFSPLFMSEMGSDELWSFIEPGEAIDNLNSEFDGRYVYLRLEFLPDGSDNNLPLVQDITLSYIQNPIPPAPSGFTAEAENGSVFLSWNPVLGRAVEGYLLYYGEKSGEFFGNDASEGVSPIDLGNRTEMTISGLTNGKMYYFRIASYNRYNAPSRGLYRERNISREVFARPSRILE